MSNLDSLGAGSVLFSRTQSTPAPLHLQHDVISKVGGGSSFLGAGSTFLGRTRSTSSSYDSFSEDGTAAQAPADIKSLLYHKAGSDPSARSMVHFQHLNRLNSSSTSSSVLPNINVATEIALGHIAASPSISGTRQRFASNRASRNKVKATAGVMRLVAREGGGDGAAAIGGVRFSMLDHQSAFGKKSKKKKQGDLSLLMPMQVLLAARLDLCLRPRAAEYWRWLVVVPVTLPGRGGGSVVVTAGAVVAGGGSGRAALAREARHHQVRHYLQAQLHKGFIPKL